MSSLARGVSGSEIASDEETDNACDQEMNQLESELALAVRLLPTVVFFFVLNKAILNLGYLSLQILLLSVDLIELGLDFISFSLDLISVHNYLRLSQ